MQRDFFHPSKYGPWVKKMNPEDRLIINHTPEKAPKIEGLDWHLVTGNVWSGRLPRDTEDKEEVEKQDKEKVTAGEGKAKEGVKK
jgi:hypothetical protein